ENAIFESENQSENDCQVVENEYDQMENSKVIAPEMFKLSVSQSVSPISVTKTSCDSKNVEMLEDLNIAVLFGRRNGHLILLMLICILMCDLFDKNNLFIFDDESVRISRVSKMPFRKKPSDSMNVRSKSKLNKSLPRTVHRLSRFIFWIIDSGCSKHMTGNRALLTNFVEKFLGTVRFGNNDFAVIAGYGDVVIGSMSIKKVYYVEGLGHNLFSVGQFCDKGLGIHDLSMLLLRLLLFMLGLTIYGFGWLMLLYYSPSMLPLLSLPLSMASDMLAGLAGVEEAAIYCLKAMG
nr:integrase, catalytic region, zinc finger, CCHC-type, peptidase aspartic, catalytic [Tanacetum cinerariifolium]